MKMVPVVLILASLIIWTGLLLSRGRFWLSDQRFSENQKPLPVYPSMAVIVPARNEAELIETSLQSLLSQDYPGLFHVVLVDDQSTDETARMAQQTAVKLNRTDQVKIIPSPTLPEGWTGKLWAMAQGIQYANTMANAPEYILFTDADIKHSTHNIKSLMEMAELEHLQLVSLMVLLNCQSFWEKLLIPAFVLFFQKLYPFRWVNDSKTQIAAAAGGCILIRREALTRVGGLEVLKNALIDDCALAQKVKGVRSAQRTRFPVLNFLLPLQGESCHPIWLGLTETTRSLRSYPDLSGIWNMVARTAFSQLNDSMLLLGLTLTGMILIYLTAPMGLIWGVATENAQMIYLSALVWLFMAIAYYPTLKLYRLCPVRGFTLPLAGFLYSLMTFDSALRHWRGKRGNWKGRTYR